MTHSSYPTLYGLLSTLIIIVVVIVGDEVERGVEMGAGDD